jgi:hypothetical protein
VPTGAPGVELLVFLMSCRFLSLRCGSVSASRVLGRAHALAQEDVGRPFARDGLRALHQLGATDAERILKVLARPGTVAVDGYPEALDAEFRRRDTSLC